MQQSVQLLHVKDPWFKRMGASRLARFAIDGNAFIHVSLINLILNLEILGIQGFDIWLVILFKKVLCLSCIIFKSTTN